VIIGLKIKFRDLIIGPKGRTVSASAQFFFQLSLIRLRVEAERCPYVERVSTVERVNAVEGRIATADMTGV
jgi:hypothetical protein